MFICFSQNNCEGTPNTRKQVTYTKLALLLEKAPFEVVCKNQEYESVLSPSSISSFFFSLDQVVLLP